MTDRSSLRRIKKRLMVVNEGVDIAFKKGLEKIGVTPTCQKGCSHCCHQATMITLSEAIAIVVWLAEHGQLESLRHLKQDEAAQQVRLLLQSTMDRRKYYQLQLPCIFLRGNTCSVYEVRPGACRTHVSLEDPDHCKPGWTEPIASVDTSASADYIARHSAKDAEQLGIPLIFAPLPLAIAWAIRAWTEGIDVMKAKIMKTPYGISPAHGMAQWMHLIADDPGIAEHVKVTDLDKNTRRVEFKP